MTRTTLLRVASNQCTAGRPIPRRTCALPVKIRVIPENEIPRALHVDIYLALLVYSGETHIYGAIHCRACVFALFHSSPYGKGRWCEAPEGIRKSENGAGRGEMTAFFYKSEVGQDNPSVMLAHDSSLCTREPWLWVGLCCRSLHKGAERWATRLFFAQGSRERRGGARSVFFRKNGTAPRDAAVLVVKCGDVCYNGLNA